MGDMSNYTLIPPHITEAVKNLSSGALGSKPVDFDFGKGYPETWDYTPAAWCETCGAIVVSGDDHNFTLVDVDGAPVTNPDDGQVITVGSEDGGDDEWGEFIALRGEVDSWKACEYADRDARDLDPHCEGPVMSYYYPLDLSDPSDAARKLVDTCLVVVDVGGVTGLALNSGGMDLSWEICEAFILLGFLPPTHFADLPSMAGLAASEGNLTIIAACQRSTQVAIERLERNQTRLNHLQGDLRWLEA
jgi:hypothetical protein